MKFVIQKVSQASVSVEGTCIGKINQGFLVFVGIGKEDTKELADQYIKKMVQLRIFQDKDGKTNLSLADVKGEILIISQFTLYANCKKGNRPSFFNAGEPEMAEALYEYIIQKTKEMVPVVETGKFGALMEVSLVNEGPFTIILDETTFSK
ncbi:MAG: D-aminoacyl-tRNA deacylase [Blautia sp.]